MDVEFPAYATVSFDGWYYAAVFGAALLVIIGLVLVFAGPSKGQKAYTAVGAAILAITFAGGLIAVIGAAIWSGVERENTQAAAANLLIDAAEERYGIVISVEDAREMVTPEGDDSGYRRPESRLNMQPAEGSVVAADDATLQLPDGTFVRAQLMWNHNAWILIRAGDETMTELPTWR